MQENNTSKILIVTSLSEKKAPKMRERSFGDALKKEVLNSVNSLELKKNVNIFLKNLTDILNTEPAEIGAFQIEQVEVSAQITAEGKIALMGSGAKVDVDGGLKFLLKRVKK
ncbi:hypothetical protein QUF75_02280 [Desulfococcaceae bacterium HSG7]|nr:hypothetical protein [Desulfococcaceae bacterium HSG7]